MKLWITIDNLDGSSTVHGPLYPDQIDTWGMLLRLSQSRIAGITFTNAEPLRHLIKERAEGSSSD